jgi:histidine triad (HIT) family protein
MAEYTNKTKEGKCIFCEIASGRIEPLKGGKFWENKRYIAWLSPFPNTKGFTVLIPKKHYPSDVLQMPDKELAELIIEAKKISNILINKLKDVGRVGLIIEGTGIDHAHIKLIPLQGTGYMKTGEWRQIHSKVNSYFENYEGYISSNDGPEAREQEITALAKILKSK